jgi:hypothetical protein
VAKIQQQLAPKAEVRHNVLLDGHLSGRKRQIDVLVREKIGQYEINIIIDCKDYNKPVDVKGVEEFYGLFQDVGAQKGVLVCPKGFTQAAKVRADGFQIDLYSPFDTDRHKWQVTATIPAICDFRAAAMSFQFSCSAPVPFRLVGNFYTDLDAFDHNNTNLGKPLHRALQKWNDGIFPDTLGYHDHLAIFDTPTVLIDSGYGMRIPVDLTVGLKVERQQLFFGQLPVPHVSGFKDELSGRVITNAFTFGILDPDEVEAKWQKISSESDAAVTPVIHMVGRVLWEVN